MVYDYAVMRIHGWLGCLGGMAWRARTAAQANRGQGSSPQVARIKGQDASQAWQCQGRVARQFSVCLYAPVLSCATPEAYLYCTASACFARM